MTTNSITVYVKRDHIQWHKQALRALQDKGSPKDRAERALIATGHKDADTAYKWLKAHAADPSISNLVPRQFVLFLCPVGDFADQLNKFWEDSFKQYGRNAVHNSFPHITLTSFFQVEDFRVPPMLDILDQVVQNSLSKRPEKFRRFLHKAQGYLGIFLEESSTNWLSESVSQFAEKIKTALGVTCTVQRRQMHLTLAHQFDQEHQKPLENLSQQINLEASTDWELHVYSRDAKVASKQILLVTHAYARKSKDELELTVGQHLIIEKEQFPYKGWLKGTCFETGKSGSFPGNHTKRSSEWKCWTKHWAYPLPKLAPRHDRKDFSPPVKEEVQFRSSATLPRGSNLRNNQNQANHNAIVRGHSLSLDKKPKFTNVFSRASLKVKKQVNDSDDYDDCESPRPRQVFVMRHAERVDMTFGHDWLQQFFDSNGGYHRRNLNLPRRMPTRRGGPKNFSQDSPITEIGVHQAKLTGESLWAHGISVSHVFCSPALRCVQTANSVIEGLQAPKNVKISVETGLYEWLAWCGGNLPRWMTVDELAASGLRVDTKYIPVTPLSSLHLDETAQQYYNRSFSCMRTILRSAENSGGNVLVVAHAASLDVCTRQVAGGAARSQDEMVRIAQRIPYCGLTVIEEDQKGEWRLIQPPIPSLSHGPNGRFDWRMLLPKEVTRASAV